MRRLIFILALLLTSLQAAAQDQPPCAPSYFGVTTQLGWTWFYRSDEDVERALDMLQEAGIGRVRLNWSWKDFQKVPGPFTFERFDVVARLANEHGIELLPILLGIPQWASTAPDELKAERGDMSPVDRYRPVDLTGWLTYVSTVVERYDSDGTDDAPGSPRINAWEVWNEPNLSFYWPPEPNVQEYATMLAATHDAIKAADPSANVVLGGLSGSGVNAEGTGFLQQLYDLGGGANFDVLSMHRYVYPNGENMGLLRESLEAARAEMDANGDADKPLWLTEIGWSDAPEAWGLPTAAQEDIAAWLTEVYTTPLPADAIFWYSLRNQDIDEQVEHNFGLLERDFTPKPAWEAYRAVAQACGAS
jgi:polysaccharide biosynthesis protein PslG